MVGGRTHGSPPTNNSDNNSYLRKMETSHEQRGEFDLSSIESDGTPWDYARVDTGSASSPVVMPGESSPWTRRTSRFTEQQELRDDTGARKEESQTSRPKRSAITMMATQRRRSKRRRSSDWAGTQASKTQHTPTH